jgi:uncharacterized SAM-binding protein YcdF (DUF218 family)
MAAALRWGACVVAAAALLVSAARALAAARRAARRAATLPCDHVLLLGGCARVTCAAAHTQPSPHTRTRNLICRCFRHSRRCRRSDLFRERTAAALLSGAAPPSACLAPPRRRGRGATSSVPPRNVTWMTLPVLVSSAHGGARAAFLAAGVAPARLCVDERATDTVTNFTTAAPLLSARGARHVAVLTSASHARRASAVAALAFRAAGLGATVVALKDGTDDADDAAVEEESLARCARDAARALLWALTGVHGGALGRWAHPERFYHIDAAARAGASLCS